MSANKHNSENKGFNPRDLIEPRHRSWKNAHRDWRLWFMVGLMLAMILVYVITNDLSFRPGEPPAQRMPAANLP
jgi:hypothetical protein